MESATRQLVRQRAGGCCEYSFSFSSSVRILGILCLLSAALFAEPSEPGPFEQPPVPPPGNVWKFDFGKKTTPVGKGFYGVFPDTLYSKQQQFGFVKARGRPVGFDQNRQIIRDTLIVDDVTRDNISRLWPFQLGLPNGKYRVAVLTGAFNRPGANRPDTHFRQYSISANRVDLYSRNGTVEEFYHPEGRYFHSYYRDWHPDVNLYRAVIEPWIPMREKEVQVTDGKLVIQATSYAAINAPFVFPADNPGGKNAVDAFRKSQEAFFNEQFKYLPSLAEHPMPELPEQVSEYRMRHLK